MEINIEYNIIVDQAFLARSQAASMLAPLSPPLVNSAEEKKFPLEEELQEYRKSFKAQSEAAIATYLGAPSFKIATDTVVSGSNVPTQTQPTTSEFLKDTKDKYRELINLPQEQLPTLHFVMGNESADLDSIISSIAYAYLLKRECTDKETLYIPLLNIRREDIALRKDALYLFQLFNISVDDLLFLDDNVPLNSLFDQDKLRLNLVDHNLLRPSLEHLSDAVESIIDHHVDEHKNYPLIDEKDTVIAVVGSATTLVAEKMLESKQIAMTPELAALLLGPILIDTAALKSAEKTTERDRKAFESLSPIASSLISPDYYDKLIDAKNDTSGLTTDMLLNKDFKAYLDGELLYGISSTPAGVCWGKEDEPTLIPALEKFAKDQDLAFLIVLMTNPDPNAHNRKIIVYSPSEELLGAFEAYVHLDKALSEVLIPQLSDRGGASYYVTEQFISRKQLQPLFHFSQNPDLMSVFKDMKNSSSD